MLEHMPGIPNHDDFHIRNNRIMPYPSRLTSYVTRAGRNTGIMTGDIAA